MTLVPKTPVEFLLENLMFSQFKYSVVLIWSNKVHCLPVPIREPGNMMVWKGTLSLPMNCTSLTLSGFCHQSLQESVQLAVIEMQPIGASYQTQKHLLSNPSFGTGTPHLRSLVMHLGLRPSLSHDYVIEIELLVHEPDPLLSQNSYNVLYSFYRSMQQCSELLNSSPCLHKKHIGFISSVDSQDF